MSDGNPYFEIKPSDTPPMKGHYFILYNGAGEAKMESNVFDDKQLCEVGAQEELKNWIEGGKFDE